MFFNYLKIAVRILTRNKLVSIINVVGLALALAGSLLIAVFIHDELSYDRYHDNADRIYRVTRNYVRPDGSPHMHLGHLAAPFGPLLKNDFADIVESVRALGPFSPSMVPGETDESESVEFENAYFIEPSVFDIFSVEVMSGNKNTALDEPLTMMLSDEAAQRFLGGTDVIGKKLRFYDRIVEITGTFKAFPEQSHWHPHVLISFSTLNDEFFAGKLENNWENNSFLTYILVNDAFNPIETERLFPSFIDRHMPMNQDGIKKSASTNLFLQPLTSIYLHSHLDSEAEANGNINHVFAMGSVGIFLIIIACFNFVNLATARATQRGKEVGLRKVSGAMRKQLIFQYISESILITLLAMIIAIAITSACLFWLNDFTGKSIRLNDYLKLDTMMILGGFVVVLGAVAGLYPAFVISSYKPSQILKGKAGSVREGGSGIRKALVVTQFSISIVMIIATLIINQQLQFLTRADLGYSNNQIVFFALPEAMDERYDAVYNTLMQHPAIENVARSNRMPTLRLLETNNVQKTDGDGEKIVVKNVSVDREFFETYQIPIVSGKNFLREIRRQDPFMEKVANGFILNETACRLLGWTNDEAVGKEFLLGGTRGTVVGVVKDFHFESMHEPIAPIVFITYAGFRLVSARIDETRLNEGIAHLEKAWQQFVAFGEPFEYEFLSERYRRLYQSETSQQELFFVFAALAIFIASLGLFGLATFNAIQRSKEVCIRKVLGASVQNILQLLIRESVLLILIANAIAWPVAWYVMKEWLGRFAYRVEMDILTFVVAGVLTLLVTLITISTQTLKVAMTNPATMLKNE